MFCGNGGSRRLNGGQVGGLGTATCLSGEFEGHSSLPMNSLQLVAPVLSQLCHVCRHAILLKDEPRWQNRSAFLNKFRQQGFSIKFSIHFGLVWNEMQSFLQTKTDARRNHDINKNYKLLLIFPCRIENVE